MNRNEVYNFSAGPSVMAESVLRRAQQELMNHGGSGMSVMEMSHRSKQYAAIFDQTKEKLIRALDVPDTHAVLFLQGGASTQFSMIPLNLLPEVGCADYAVTGHFSANAAKEAKKYGSIAFAADTSDVHHTRIPTQEELRFTDGAAYFHYCANNTIYGTEWQYVPKTSAPLVCDMSSDILSRPINVSDYGLIYAGAQKNMAPAGLTVVIVDKRLAGHERADTPLMLSYQRMIEKDSMFNTPPCWCIYMLGLVLDWLAEQGGVAGMEQLKSARAKKLYDHLDNSRLFHANAAPGSRSDMNVTFRTGDEAADAAFVKGAAEQGLLNLKGHRVTGGMRASIYNAMPMEGVDALLNYMKRFEVEYHG
ncbi:MAG: 3-phosphoserine/phosphohydroxythreonine transaminase [Oscillospiraceae bacterium]|nr:3-phosphoserine/phosphohydroxythreonine transaminase [Oscillospiraceae bacterium]